MQRVELDFVALGRAMTETADGQRTFLERIEPEGFLDIDLVDGGGNERREDRARSAARYIVCERCPMSRISAR